MFYFILKCEKGFLSSHEYNIKMQSLVVVANMIRLASRQRANLTPALEAMALQSLVSQSFKI